MVLLVMLGGHKSSLELSWISPFTASVGGRNNNQDVTVVDLEPYSETRSEASEHLTIDSQYPQLHESKEFPFSLTQ